MNLFILALHPKEIAQAMMDKHVVKIILEAVQVLCTAKRVLSPGDPINEKLYRITHVNHPVSKWCRASKANFVWTLNLIEAMHDEWKYRFPKNAEKTHKSVHVARLLRDHMPPDSAFPTLQKTPFALAMPDQYKIKMENGEYDAVASYRAYYMSPDKQKIASWKDNRGRPAWYKPLVSL